MQIPVRNAALLKGCPATECCSPPGRKKKLGKCQTYVCIRRESMDTIKFSVENLSPVIKHLYSCRADTHVRYHLKQHVFYHKWYFIIRSFLTTFIISSHFYTLHTNVYDLVCCSLCNIFLSQAEFQCNNINFSQHVVRLLRLMVGSLRRYNQRVIPHRQVHKWPDGLYSSYNLSFFNIGNWSYWAYLILKIYFYTECTAQMVAVLIASLLLRDQRAGWSLMGKKELESTLPILQDFLSQVT